MLLVVYICLGDSERIAQVTSEARQEYLGIEVDDALEISEQTEI